ncbi:MAG TPA: DPP IV N-terminal domain-containing protein [Anaerolineae bacterium]|nr:DPP IV N-terminal domain-containing protein [Anaerolineae bacterium]
MEDEPVLLKVWRWLIKPRAVRLPPVAWALLVAGLLVLFTQLPRDTIEIFTERTILITPTPQPGGDSAGQDVPAESPGATPTPVGSGGTLAFTMRHNGNSDIYLLSQGTGNLLRLTFDAGEDRDPAWSPDGRMLAFASHRARSWDLYMMDMQSGTVLRLTRSDDFEAGPTWSPDAQWLAYERYYESNLDIYILNVSGGESIRLTNDPAPEYSPAWSPDGRYIAFTSYREKNKDLFLISLDDGTVSNLTNTPNQDEDYAAWSPDGAYLAYSAGVPGDETTWIIPFDKEALATGELRPMLFGVGRQPVWSPDGKAMGFIFQRQTTSYLISASTTGWALAQEGYTTMDALSNPDWSPASLGAALEERLKKQMAQDEPPLYTELLFDASGPTYRLVDLPDVNSSNTAEKLSDKVNDSYNAMRQTVKEKTGWDYMAILGDSWRTMNHTPRPGQGRISWHVCGRAVDINQGYLGQGNIELAREDIGGVTYWRVFIKAEKQDGSLGEPLRVSPWDLNARSKGGIATVYGGELKAAPPSGYYVDFTTIAADFGWERRNALSGWRTSYFDIEWWHFQKTEGLSWYECMTELYPAAEVTASYGALPWWTKRPEWEVQAMPW